MYPSVTLLCYWAVAWRKGLRRILHTAHSRLLPFPSNSLPIFAEISKQSAKFIRSCLCSGSALVRTVINRGLPARSDSFIGRNAMFLSSRYHFSVADIHSGQASHLTNIILRYHRDTVFDADLYAVNLLHFGLRRAAAFVSSPVHLLKLTYVCESYRKIKEAQKCSCLYTWANNVVAHSVQYKQLHIWLSASLYVSKRGAYWDRMCRDVVGWLSRACTVAKRCILGL